MKPKKTILLDMDGVLVDLLPWWLKTIAETTGVVATEADVTQWKLHKAQPYVTAGVTPKQVYDDCFNRIEFWENAPPNHDLLAVIEGLRQEQGMGRCEWLIVSSPANAISAAGKTNWVKRWLGDQAVRRLVLCDKKEFVHGDIIVDDRDDNVSDFLSVNDRARAIVPVYPYLNKSKLLRFGNRVVYTNSMSELCLRIETEMGIS